ETALEKGFQRVAQRLVALALKLFATIGGNAPRHRLRNADRLQHGIDGDEQQDRQQDEEIERQIDAVRRIEEHHIADIEVCRHGQSDGGGEQYQDPEKEAHVRYGRRSGGRTQGLALKLRT